MTYGIKISQPSFDVGSCLDNQLSFSSQFDTLKIFSQGTGALLDSSRIATISHNLGYVPSFVVHSQGDPTWPIATYGSQGDYFITPVTSLINQNDNQIMAYADGTNLYIKAGDNFGWKYYYTDFNQFNYCDYFHSIDFFGNGVFETGYSTANIDGALRFDNVTINQGQSIVKAEISVKIEGRFGSGDIPVRKYCINEDNTGDFGSNPFGRSRTTAFIDDTLSGNPNTFKSDAKSIVQEVINRPGWSSGNHLGIFFFNNGGTVNSAFYDSASTDESTKTFLRVLTSNNIANFKYTIYRNQIA